jgi:hypothetical protein
MENIQKSTLKKIVILSLQELILSDIEIFSQESTIIEYKNIQAGTNNRLVHETAINHRFAIYLEQNLNIFLCCPRYYQVDIEYNRYFGQPKELNGDNIRPDILVHKRQGKNLDVDNLLIIEAKKIIVSNEDEQLVKDMMQNKKYLFQYGLTVTYCFDNDTKIKCKLFSKIKGEITEDTFELLK